MLYSMSHDTDTTALRVNYLHKLMATAGISQNHLARTSGVPVVTINRVLNSYRDPGNTLPRLEATLTEVFAKRVGEFAITLGDEDRRTNSGQRAELFGHHLKQSMETALEAIKA
jgi:hypothetical protein